MVSNGTSKKNVSVQRVLFLCLRNSSRSKMAKAFMDELAKGRFVTDSAGTRESKLSPVEIQVMEEAGLPVDVPSNTIFNLFNEGKIYDYVISICDETSEACSVYPGVDLMAVWKLSDPAFFKGTRPERLAKTREVRDGIKRKVKAFLVEHAVTS